MSNLVVIAGLNPEDFSSEWNLGGITVEVSAGIAPDGTNTANKLEETAENTYHKLDTSPHNLTVGVGYYVASVFVKAGERPLAAIDYIADFFFDLTDGGDEFGFEGKTLGVDYGIEDFGSGWYRIWAEEYFEGPATWGPTFVLLSKLIGQPNWCFYLGEVGNGLYAWGAQAELVAEHGAGPGPYVATSGWNSSEIVPLPPVHAEAVYADFDSISSFRPVQWTFSDEEVVFDLEEPKSVIKKKIPLTLFSYATYPNMSDDLDGKPIPAGYGRIYGAEAKPIDVTTRKFKVVSHAIKGFLACYAMRLVEGTETETAVPIGFLTVDTANAEFTLAEADWAGSERILVDFEGRKNADGTLMENAADIVESILVDLLGLPSSTLDSAAFAAAAARLKTGTDSRGVSVSVMRPAVYLDEEEDADDVIAAICELVGGYFFGGYDGLHRFVVFEPSRGEGLTVFEHPATLFSVEEDSDATGIISLVRAKYRMAAVDEESAWISVHERIETQRLRGATSALVAKREIATSEPDDADHYAQRTTRMEGVPLRLLTIEVDHRAWMKQPSDQIRLVHSGLNIDGVFEVIDVKRSLDDMTRVRLIVGDLHGLKDHAGFWVADAPVFPARLGGGSCAAWSAAWTAAQKAWAKANVGFWVDDNGYADPADPDSYMPSAWV